MELMRSKTFLEGGVGQDRMLELASFGEVTGCDGNELQ